MDKFSELKAAAMAATDGPWFRSSVQFNGITTEATFITQGNKPHLASTSEKRDAIFIAAANPATVLALLAELEATESRLHEVATACATAEQRSAELETANKSQDDHIIQQQDRSNRWRKLTPG